MIRKVVLGAAALSLVVGGLAVGASPASAAKPKMNGSISCSNTVSSATFTPGLKLTPTKKIALAFNSTQSGCTVTNGTAGGETVKSIVITGTGKLKNAAATGLIAPSAASPVVIKATLAFKNAVGTVICTNKAKLATGATTITGQVIGFSAVSSNFGGKNLGGKCFKGKPVITTGNLTQTVNQMAAAATGPLGVTAININNGTLSIP